MTNDSEVEITNVEIKDTRFQTSNHLDGSNAMNLSPDYSSDTVILHTTRSDLQEHGMTFTLGRGNEICVKAIESLQVLSVGQKLTDIIYGVGKFWKHMKRDNQLSWIGTEITDEESQFFPLGFFIRL